VKAPLLAILVVAALGGAAAADVPSTMTFTARVTDGEDALDGEHVFVFRIWDAETGGALRWSESHGGVDVEDGLVAVALGASSPLGPAVLDGAPLWIEIVLDGETMAPRLPLRSVPYATRTRDADLLGGQAATAFAPAVHNHDAAYVNADGDTVNGALNLSGDLVLSSKSALRGTDSWLRLNQDSAFTSGTHSPRNLNVSGLTVGALYFDPGAGALDVEGPSTLRGGARMNGIAVGNAPFGALPYPYETIQLDPGFNLRFAFGGTERMRLENGGRLFMGTNPGDCPNGWFCNGMFWDLSVASILYSGLSQRSDARLKKDVRAIEGGLETVRALRPVTFAWRDPAIAGRHHGFIAQEVREVVPDLVSTTTDGTLALDTTEMLPILMQAVKELDAQNDELRREVEALRAGRVAAASPPPRGPSAAWMIGLGALGALGLVGLFARLSRRAG
jgi:hypothetical protein